MKISKDDGLDLSKPKFHMRQQSGINPIAKWIEKVPDVNITKSIIKRKLRIEDLRTAEAKAKAWFVVPGEVSAYFRPRAVPIYAASRSIMAVVMSKHIMAGRRRLCSSLANIFHGDPHFRRQKEARRIPHRDTRQVIQDGSASQHLK